MMRAQPVKTKQSGFMEMSGSNMSDASNRPPVNTTSVWAPRAGSHGYFNI